MTVRFVAFEGIDGSGKTTQAALLARRVAELGDTPIELEEPSRGPMGRRARASALVDGAGLARQRELFTLDRRDQVERKIGPLLRFMNGHGGFMLISSRYYLSAPAYQADGEDEAELVAILAEQRAFAPAPDLFVVLDLPVQEAIARIETTRVADAFETVDRLDRVRRRYATLRRLDTAPQIWIDALAPIGEVHRRVLDAVFGAGGL